MRLLSHPVAGRGFSPWSFLYLLPLIFLGVAFFYPLARILGFSLDLDALATLVDRPGYYTGVLWFTIWQATASTLLTLLIGLPAAYLFARYTFPGKRLLKALTAVPFVMPTVVVAAAFRALLGPSGPINDLLRSLTGGEQPALQLEQTLAIILLAHVFYNTTIVIRLVGGFWANLNPRLVAAARIMGATRFRAFREITLPLLRPALVGAALLVFLFTFTSFGVILLLGGPGFSTIETEIYYQYIVFLRPDIAAILSLIQIIFTFLLMTLYARRQTAQIVPLDFRPQKTTARRPETSSEKLLVGGLVIFLFLFLVTPLLALVAQSLLNRQGDLTLAYYQALPELRRGSFLFISPLAAMRNSLFFALFTVLAAGSLGLISARMLTRPERITRWFEPVFMLPLGVSAVTLGFGYVVTFSRWQGSPYLILAAHALVAFPFVVRSLLPVMQAIRPNLREAAAVLGATPGRVWREIDLPIIGRALLVAAMFAFTVSMGEFGASSFVARANSEFATMPVAIARYLGQPGALNFGQAMAMSTLLMLVTAAGFIAIERFRYGDIGEF